MTNKLLTFRDSFRSYTYTLRVCRYPHIDNNIAIAVEARGRAGWDDAGCIVFLDDAGPSARLVEIGTVDDISVAPAMDRTEIGLPQGLRDNNTCRQICLGRQCRARHVGEAAADHFQGDKLHRLLDAGAVAIGLFVLDAKGFVECREDRPVDHASRHRNL